MILTEAQLIERLQPRLVRYFSQIGSTNNEALTWLANGAVSGSVVIAGEQVKGKGRLGRTWFTPPDSALIVTVILRPQAQALTHMTMVGALAIYDMIKGLGLEQVGIKWPNDVLLNGLKVSGILPEVVWENGQLMGVVLGMGVNVRIDFTDTELAEKAVSIEPVLGKRVELIDLIEVLLSRIDYWAAQFGTTAVYETWRNRLVTLGQQVSIRTADREVTGVAETVEHDGSLFVRLANGQIERVIAGDVALG
ncbi:MAG: biotin--[acetyl-CoA-carboxylase] ligase [Chloroflexi bacterium]|nr:biotin--[acetyl-CoA-carboxylase] ligase [Chloroflexota bacterium]MCC6896511.1 biotin--[acetyl-CoA-carboxylase] ligase [Anaerolineae bacterium]